MIILSNKKLKEILNKIKKIEDDIKLLQFYKQKYEVCKEHKHINPNIPSQKDVEDVLNYLNQYNNQIKY